ncbi:unnamed protein product [Citrullus colocynthis]|uniref:Uncharacterized protein n=1 Tax=Citrullus colocynthis TaxID=252529 RepID=A0ABP0YCA4_9ROSI
MKHAPAPAPVLPTPIPIFVYCFQIYDSLGQDEEEDYDCLQNRGVPKIPRKIAIDPELWNSMESTKSSPLIMEELTRLSNEGEAAESNSDEERLRNRSTTKAPRVHRKLMIRKGRAKDSGKDLGRKGDPSCAAV